jgi:carboxymethylenebutenolidase
VILYPDAGSVRDVTHGMASRLAGLGYVVLSPHIFYRAGDYPPFDVKTVFANPAERERLMKLVRSLDHDSAMRDAGHYLRALAEQPGVAAGPMGCIGYCIGGRLAFSTAGSHPEKIGAAACIHGGGISTDAPDSPHLLAGAIRARLYFGIADNDPSCTPEQQGRLMTALAAAHVRFTIDHFSSVSHGYAMTDFPVYAAEPAELHWRRAEELFAAGLGSK